MEKKNLQKQTSLTMLVRTFLAALCLMLISGHTALLHAQTSTNKQIYDDTVETNAQFIGGDKACFEWLAQNVRYPAEAIEQGIQGRVIVQFIVEKDGSLSEVKAIRSPHESLAKEAVRVIQTMPKWTPAMQGNKPVRSRFNLPVVFKLSADDGQSSPTEGPQGSLNQAHPTEGSQEAVADSKIMEVVEVPSQFPDGEQACYAWLAQNIRYPAEAQQKGIQGRVFVQFVVNTDGSIVDVKAVRSPDPLLSKEAVRVIQAMPKWKPAMLGGKPVRSRFNLPIMFRLSNPEKKKEP